jgi:2-polyprenyl-3-methyl-5-hydroxy-6-metoxy-1,4-benzoquinol methylase
LEHCPVCDGISGGSLSVPSWRVPESGSFTYLECSACGARWLRDTVDLAPFYGSSYYSHSGRRVGHFQRWRARAYELGLWHLGSFDPRFHGALASVVRLTPPKSARILDVGCGEGQLLHLLASLGYERLLGIDPYLRNPSEGPIRLVRTDLRQLEGEFDIVMLHHAIEHDADPIGILRTARRVLAKNGRVIVRTPVLDSWAAEQRGPKWIQHDAPIHLVLHTRKSLALAGQLAGLRVIELRDDATTRLTGRNPFFVSRLNRAGRGDQVCVVFGVA